MVATVVALPTQLPRARFAVFQGDRRMSVAQILFSLNQEENDHSYGHVKSVRVHRDFRGMGLGPLLFKEVRCDMRHRMANCPKWTASCLSVPFARNTRAFFSASQHQWRLSTPFAHQTQTFPATRHH